MKNIKISFIALVIAIAIIAAVYAGDVLQNRKMSADIASAKIVSPDLKDSVEIIGTLTNDDPWKEVAKLAEAYYAKSGIMYKGAVKVIDDNTESEKIVEEQSFQYTLLDNDYHYRLGNLEVVSKKDFLMAVDHSSKTISYMPQLSYAKNRQHTLFDMVAFKKLMLKGKANARVTQEGEDKILTIDSITDAVIQGYRIYYSPRTYRIHKMLIGMVRVSKLEDVSAESHSGDICRDGDSADGEEAGPYYYYLETIFTNVQELTLNEKDFHPENEFITIHNKKIELTDAYRNYQLLNTIQP